MAVSKGSEKKTYGKLYWGDLYKAIYLTVNEGGAMMREDIIR